MPGLRERMQPVLKPFQKLFKKKSKPQEGEAGTAEGNDEPKVDQVPDDGQPDTNGHAEETAAAPPAATGDNCAAAATNGDAPPADTSGTNDDQPKAAE